MAKDEKKIWNQYKVRWSFPGNLFGSVPKDKNIMSKWLESRKPKATPPNARSIEQVQEEVVSTMLETDELPPQGVGFQFLDGNLVVRGATIRAHLKDCGRIVSRMYVGKIKGEATLAWKITNGLYVNEYWVPVHRIQDDEKKPITAPDGTKEILIHAMTPMGPVNSIKLADFVSGVEFEFTLSLVHGLRITDIEKVMQYGALHGYAGERSMGEGRYLYEIKEVQ